jgi:hypothetical protein
MLGVFPSLFVPDAHVPGGDEVFEVGYGRQGDRGTSPPIGLTTY